MTRDLVTGAAVFRTVDDTGLARIEAHGLEVGSVKAGEYSISDGDPLSAKIDMRWTHRLGRGDWQVRTETRTVMTATADAFLIQARMEAYEGDECVTSRDWDERIARDLV